MSAYARSGTPALAFKSVLSLSPFFYARAARRKSFDLKAIDGVLSLAAARMLAPSQLQWTTPMTITTTRPQTRVEAANDGQEILSYAVGKSTLGTVLVASSAKGVAAILIGDDTAALVEELQASFPGAALRATDDDRLIGRVVGLVEDPSGTVDLRLDIRGTPFQQKVWAALQAIPAGVTETYSDLAIRVGDPKAVRTVAGACAANKLAVAIPCHRVLRTDGSLSGYRWGVERKRALIEREAAPVRVSA
jgi:AraC family transcriptional regulator of adaptative response/methylated-DNA-[protein]-cysteine methyltransferase